MNTGTIVRLIRDRGFGFIRMENGEEIFFHATGMSTFPLTAWKKDLPSALRLLTTSEGVGSGQ